MFDSIVCHNFIPPQDTCMRHQICATLILAFQGHLRLNLKVHLDHHIAFLLVVNRTIYGPIWLLYELQAFKNGVTLTDLSRSLKVKSNGTVGLPKYDYQRFIVRISLSHSSRVSQPLIVIISNHWVLFTCNMQRRSEAIEP